MFTEQHDFHGILPLANYLKKTKNRRGKEEVMTTSKVSSFYDFPFAPKKKVMLLSANLGGRAHSYSHIGVTPIRNNSELWDKVTE